MCSLVVVSIHFLDAGVLTFRVAFRPLCRPPNMTAMGKGLTARILCHRLGWMHLFGTSSPRLPHILAPPRIAALTCPQSMPDASCVPIVCLRSWYRNAEADEKSVEVDGHRLVAPRAEFAARRASCLLVRLERKWIDVPLCAERAQASYKVARADERTFFDQRWEKLSENRSGENGSIRTPSQREMLAA